MKDELNYILARTVAGKQSRRAFLGRAGALGLSAAMANGMLASAVQAAGPVKGGTLIMGLGGGESTNSLDPALAASQVPFHVLRTKGETLVDTTATGELDFRAAEAVESTPDAKTWMFKIRKGIEFHNGKTLTPDDVLLTLQRHANQESQSGAYGIMQGIESMKVDGDYVAVTLATANADLPYLMSDYHLQMQPGGGMENPADGIGAGCYKIVVDEPGVRHVFEKHANYWDSSRGHYDSVEFVVINDPTARMAALQSGQIHIANRVEPKVAQMLASVPGIQVKNVSGRGHYVFIMHCNTAPFDNKDLRLALKLAMDREEMVQKILLGYGSVGNDFPINASYPLFPEGIEQRKYDPEQAAALYKKSGHSGPVLLRTSEVAFPGAVDAAQLYQQQAAKAGITIEVKREPGDGYWSEVWNKQPFSTSYWGGRPVQDQMYSTAYLSTADWNDTRFLREDFDKVIIQARAELDETKRRELYRTAAMMVRDEGGLICPMFNDFIDATGPKVGGWVNHGSGEMMNGYALSRCWLEA